MEALLAAYDPALMPRVAQTCCEWPVLGADGLARGGVRSELRRAQRGGLIGGGRMAPLKGVAAEVIPALIAEPMPGTLPYATAGISGCAVVNDMDLSLGKLLIPQSRRRGGGNSFPDEVLTLVG